MEQIGAYLLENLPSLLLIVIGFILAVVEMYIPGFGVCGVLGILMLVAGVVLTAGTPLEALIMALVIIALLCVALTICIRSAARGRLAKSKLVLNAVATEAPQGSDLTYFVGRRGVTHTVLRPAGLAEFDGVKINVVSDGDFIPENAQVVVERVEGNRIVVCRADEKATGKTQKA